MNVPRRVHVNAGISVLLLFYVSSIAVWWQYGIRVPGFPVNWDWSFARSSSHNAGYRALSRGFDHSPFPLDPASRLAFVRIGRNPISEIVFEMRFAARQLRPLRDLLGSSPVERCNVLSGSAIRVPLARGINNHYAARQEGDRWSVLITQDEPMVSIGIRRPPHRSILHPARVRVNQPIGVMPNASTDLICNAASLLLIAGNLNLDQLS